MSRRTRPKIAVPIEKKKVSISITGELSLKNAFDAFVKENGFRSRAEGLKYLLFSRNERSRSSSPIRASVASEIVKNEKSKTLRSSVTTRTTLQGWTKDHIAKLEAAVKLTKPVTDAQWRKVAKTLDSDHSIEDCRLCATVKLGYVEGDTVSVSKGAKQTLRSKLAMGDIMMKFTQEDRGPAINDYFHSNAPKVLLNNIPLSNISDISCFNTPGSTVSCRSRFAANSPSMHSTPRNSTDHSFRRIVGSAAKKRADRLVHQMESVLIKAKLNAGTPKANSKTPRNRGRQSKDMPWRDVQQQSDYSELETNDDDYLSDNTPL